MGRQKLNIAVFASGKGTNFAAIVSQVKKGRLPVNIALLVSDNMQSLAIERAEDFGIKIALVKREDFDSKDDFEREIVGLLKENNIDLVVLAGFMRILGPVLLKAYKNRILNIHPALLPSFKGAHGIKDAFDYGSKITGVTVHFVDDKMDHGPIVLQEVLKIEEDDTLESLEEKIHKIEHEIYPKAIRLYIEGRLSIKGRKVVILKE